MGEEAGQAQVQQASAQEAPEGWSIGSQISQQGAGRSAGLIGSPAYPCNPGDVEAQVKEQRWYYLKSCLDALMQAERIRKDAALMAELRVFVRTGKDELNDLLDTLG